jgi:hypothetical protein
MSKEEISNFYYQVYDVIKFNYLFLLKKMPEAFERGIEKKFLSKVLLISGNDQQIKHQSIFDRFKKCLSVKRSLKKKGGIQNSKEYRFNNSEARHLFKDFDVI